MWIIFFLSTLCLPLGVYCEATFEALSGKALPQWSYVQTQADFEQLDYFRHIYELRAGLLSSTHDQIRIPKTVHFIWLGPHPFPLKSVENVKSWMAKNPSWTFCFWTDRPRPLPVPGMQMRRVQDFSFSLLGDCFQKTTCFAEQSDVLRYEILYKEGGVYVDHDVKCLKPFDALNSAYDFYCGMDLPNTTSLPTSVLITNNLIGVQPSHPILLECMEQIAKQWDQIEADYPGEDRDSLVKRVSHRTFWLFGEAVRTKNNEGDHRDIVFPAYYFDAPTEKLSIFAHHQYAGTWHETETPFEQMVRKRLVTITKKNNLVLLLVASVSAVNLAALTGFFIYLRKKRT